MKDGFYLSLDGKCIIEVRYNNFKNSGIVRSLHKNSIAQDTIPKVWIKRMFGRWNYLGK